MDGMMMQQKRIRDYEIVIGELNTGVRNSIADVAGVSVGHVTLSEDDIQTGVTAILPHQGNIFQEKLVASSLVINGFGKTTGTIQIEELGTLETPILLTNTFNASIIVILATDLPVNERQLKRMSKRATVEICKTGSIIHHGSGDIVVAFSTATKVPHYAQEPVLSIPTIRDTELDVCFRAVVEATEEAILNSMVTAKTVIGTEGHKRFSLSEFIEYVI